MLLDDRPGTKYVAETGLIGGDFPNHKTVMTASGERELKAGANELVVRSNRPRRAASSWSRPTPFKRGAYDITCATKS